MRVFVRGALIYFFHSSAPVDDFLSSPRSSSEVKRIRKRTKRPTVPRQQMFLVVNIVVVLACVVAPTHFAESAATTSSPLPPLDIQGNRLVWMLESGPQQVQLRGVDAPGALYHCVQNVSIFDGPANASQLMRSMKQWGVDIVRLPMNEACWLGAPYIVPSTSGAVYRAGVMSYVEALVSFGFYVIISLHWIQGGAARAVQQMPMPDADSIAYWGSVAEAFHSLPGHVIFDLFNEPFPDDNARDSPAAWECWQRGGAYCSQQNYTAVGMGRLVDAVRVTGARNILMLGGINYANDLDAWLDYVPPDPLQRIAASWHSYATNACNNVACWELTIAPVAASYPVIVGEIGENDCQGTYILPLMKWLDRLNTSYLAWVFMPYNCEAGPALITDYNGSCTDSYGCTYQAHLATRH